MGVPQTSGKKDIFPPKFDLFSPDWPLVPFVTLSRDDLDMHPTYSKTSLEEHVKIAQNATYKTRKVMADFGYLGRNVLDVMQEISNIPGKDFIFDTLSDYFNHLFFFRCLTRIPVHPTYAFKEKIGKNFKHFDKFIFEFTLRAQSSFGSCWIWLIQLENDALEIRITSNSISPLVQTPTCRPLFVLDLWEHSYLTDHGAKTRGYIEGFFTNLDWSFAEKASRWNKNQLLQNLGLL